MATDRASLNWTSNENHVLLNPRWPAEDLEILRRLADDTLQKQQLQGHFVLASSGTSAGAWRDIKLVFLAKSAVLAAARAVTDFFSFDQNDVFARTLPNFHVSGLGTEARASVSGGQIVDVGMDKGWSPKEFLKHLAAERVTVISLVPTQLHDLVAENLQAPPSLRLVLMGGGVTSPNLEERARNLGWPLKMSFGMTETSAMFALRDDEGERGFQIFPSMQVRIVEGRLQVRGPSLATGFARWKKNEARWKPALNGEGWFESEDQAEWRKDRLFIQGRGRDFLKIAGESVHLGTLRGLLESLALQQGMNASHLHLVARPSARRGFDLILVVQAGVPGAPELRNLYQQKVLPFERIREIVEVPEIPRTELGKVREEALLRWLDGRGESPMKSEDVPWSRGALFICQKCGKRDDGIGDSDYAEDLKKEFKSAMKELGRGKEIRVMTSSCLSLCPKNRQVLAWCPTDGETELIEFDRGEKEAVWKWLKSK